MGRSSRRTRDIAHERNNNNSTRLCYGGVVDLRRGFQSGVAK